MSLKKAAVLSAALVCITNGCASYVVREATPIPQPPAPPVAYFGVPLVIGAVEVNGTILDWPRRRYQGPATEAFVGRLAGALRRSGVFASVVEPGDVADAPADAARLVVLVNEQIDPRNGPNLGRVAIVASTLFLVQPFVTYEIEMRQEIDALATRPDGEQRAFSTRATVSALHYDAMAAQGPLVSELSVRVQNHNLEALVKMVIADWEWFRVRPAPLHPMPPL